MPEPLAESDFAPRKDSDLQGYWKGTLKTGNVTLRLGLKIAEPAEGTFRAEWDKSDQGHHVKPMSISYDRPK